MEEIDSVEEFWDVKEEEDISSLSVQENKEISRNVGEAANWLQNCRFETYEEMKNFFLYFYGNKSKQNSVTDHLKVEKCDKNCGLFESDYFFEIYNWVKFLESLNAFSEKNLILDILMLHFDDFEITEEEKEAEIKRVLKLLNDLKVTKFSNTSDLEEEKPTLLLETPEESISDSQNNQNNPRFKKVNESPIHFVQGMFFGFFFALVSLTFLGSFYSHYGLTSNQNNNNTLQENSNLQKLIPLETLKFSGKNDSINPKQFIENFEFITTQEKLNTDSKEQYFKQSLVDDAEIWILTRSFESYEQMKQDFLKFYWGSEIQDEFINFLLTGKYNEESGLSPSDYFYKNFNKAKFLDNALSENEIISRLLSHFQFKYNVKSRVSTVDTLNEAIDLLVSNNLASHWYEQIDIMDFCVMYFYPCFFFILICLTAFSIQLILRVNDKMNKALHCLNSIKISERCMSCDNRSAENTSTWYFYY